jgi:isopentenyl phosphate kinase
MEFVTGPGVHVRSLDARGRTCYIFPMLTFLKLGGSLITDKTRPYTPLPQRLDALAQEIAEALRQDPGLRLVLGHGSGSFGHQAAQTYATRQGVQGAEAWHGFAEVWFRASELNRLVLDALRKTGLPVLTFSALASVSARAGRVQTWDLHPLRQALERGLLPVVHGDVVFDDSLGGTILSTEDLFEHLALALHPDRILLAGLEKGVWADFPARSRLVTDLTAANFAQQCPDLGGAQGADVTGGMHSKVTQMLRLVEQVNGLEVLIFSGCEPGSLCQALAGENPGTRLHR